MRLKTYTGPFDGVLLPLAAGGEVRVARGDTVELPDDVAASLDGRDDWRDPPKPTRPRAPRKPTSRKSTPADDIDDDKGDA